MVKRILLSLFIFLSAQQLVAQVGVIQDAKGETSLTIADNVVAINAQDGSISFGGAFRFRNDSLCDKSKRWIGFTAKANGKDATATLFKGKDFKFDGEFGLYFFVTKMKNECGLKGPSSILQKYASLTFGVSQFTLFDSTSVYAEQLKDDSKFAPKVNVGINYYPPTKISWVLGGAINFGSASNLKELTSFKVATTSAYPGPAGQIRTVSQDEKTVYKSSAYVNSLTYLNVNADVGLIAFKRFPILFHGRYSANTERKPQFNPGFGVYVNKEGAPTEVIGGLQYQVLDAFNTSGSTKSTRDRAVLNLVAGFVIK